MFDRSPWKALLLVGLALTLAGCTNNLVDSIVIVPTTQSLAVGQTVQFSATGLQSHGTHPSSSSNVTSQVTWSSSAPSVATINASGLATAVAAGTTTISASMQGFGGVIGSTAVITVTGSGSISSEPLAFMSIDPGSQTALAVNQTVAFIAIGTTGSGATVNLTGQSVTIGSSTIKAAIWTSSNPAVATVNSSTGIATALTSGSTTISAQAINPDGTVVIGTATLTVTLPTASAEPLVSMAIIPGTQTLTSLNQPVQFIAIGTTGTGTTVNLTSKVIWTSSSPTVVSVKANTGLATALANGTAAITAVATNPDGTVVTGIGTVTVNIAATGEPIVSLAIVPGTQTASVVNQTAQFVAIGTTATGATVNLTNQSATVNGTTINAAVWGSSSAAVATISAATGLATAVSSGTVAITAQAKNPDGTVVTGTATFTVISTPEPLISLAIVPGAQTLVTEGQTADLVAIGTTASGATVNLTNVKATIGGATINAATWSSSSPSVAAVNPATGVATAGSSGNAVITAIANNPDGTAVTATATLTVNITATQEPLVSLTIIPGTQTTSVVGQTVNFIAIGTTATGATVNLTNQVATVNGATINAAVWGSSSGAVATVNPATGIATTVSSGTVAITAQAKNPDGTVVTGTATFTVISSPEPLVSLTIVPGTQALVGAGQTSQFVAIGTTSSGATVNLTNVKATIGTATINAAVWGSSDSAVATINPATGLATAATSGTTVITATAINPDGTAVTGTATLTANITATPEPLVSLTIVPNTQTASVVGQTAQYVAIGTTSSGTTVNLTNQSATVGAATINAAVWGSSSNAIATINPATGIATAVSSGTVAITAQAKNPDGTVVTSAATFTVTATPEPLVSLTIVPVAQTLVSAGETTQYIAIGTTATGATVNLTNTKATIGAATINAATWNSSTVSVATINPATGLATAASSGVTVITAIAINPDGTAVTATSTLTVNISATQEPLVSLAIVPNTQTASVVGQTAQYIAIGTTSSGVTVNLTNQSATVGTATINAAVWGSSSSPVATINPVTGLATAVSTGTVAITAQAKNPDGSVVTGTATFTVINTPEPLISLSIVPATQTLLAAGQTSQFVAIGTTSSGATVNLTNTTATIGTATINAAAWGSSNTAVATINPITGVATAATTGVTVITAIATNPDGSVVTGTATLTATLSATPEPLVSLTIVPNTQTASVVGQTAQYIAIGTTSSGTTVNLTNQSATVGAATINAAVWGSSSTPVATINPATGLATAVSTGTVAITAQAKNPDGTVVTGTATFTVISTPEPLVSLTIVPNTQTASVIGQTAQYIAIGTTASGATVNLTNQPATIGSATIHAAVWNSSIQQTATINQAGLATVPTGAVNGVTVITAVATNPDGTAVTATATLSVNINAQSEPLVSLAIIPATQTASVVAQTVQYIVIGTTSTGSTVNLTNQPATVGTATINAAVWGSSSAAIATINPATGLATAVSAGTVAITAQAKNPDGTVVTGVATFTVSPNPELLVSLAIVPGSQELTVAGQTIQYIAIGTTSSGATVNLTSSSASVNGVLISPVVWGSSIMSVATIGTKGIVGSNPGLAVAGITGVTGITAIAFNPDGTAVEGTTVLTVNDGNQVVNNPNLEPIVSLAIVPTAQFGFSVYENPRPQLVAIGTTSTGTTVNLTSQQVVVGSSTVQPATWSSSNPTIATTNPGGVVSSVATGSTAITAATVNPDATVMTGTASYTATATGSSEPLVAINVNPAVPTPLAGGQTVNLTATGISGALATVASPTVIWASSNPGVATVNAGTGVVTAVGPGVSAITATATNPDATMPVGVVVVTVTSTAPFSGSIASIAVIPASQAVAAPNDTAQYIAIGTTTTGATVNLTNSVAWSSSSAQVATIAAATGLATGTGQGTTTITAVYTPAGAGNVVTGTSQFTVAGGTTETYTAVTLIPNTQSLSEGQASQFIALGTLGTSGLEVDVTNSPQITWSSSVGTGVGAIATVSPTGLVTGKSAGSAIINAELSNPDGTLVSANSTVTVSSTTVPEQLLSLTIIPGTLSVGNLQDTGNFLAIGTFSVVPYVRDLTNDPGTTWISSFPESFPVNTNSGGNSGASAGTVTAYGTGSAVIIAEATSVDGTIQTAQATFNCPLVLPNPPLTPGSCYPGSQVSGLLVTLTIYNEGVNNTNWQVTAPSATATPDVLHCGPGWTGAGGSVCTATYPLNTTVVLTATQTGGGTGTFGGWSWDCTPSDASGTPLLGPIFYTAAGPNYCAITLGSVAIPTSNVTIGAIFN